MRTNATHLSRAARKLQRASTLTYAQALGRLKRAGTIPDLDNPTAVAAFVAATNPKVAGPQPDSAEVALIREAVLGLGADLTGSYINRDGERIVTFLIDGREIGMAETHVGDSYFAVAYEDSASGIQRYENADEAQIDDDLWWELDDVRSELISFCRTWGTTTFDTALGDYLASKQTTPVGGSVYVTTRNGGLGDIIIDGDIAVFSLDWTQLEDRDDHTLDLAIDACGLDVACRQPDGLPAALIEHALAQLEAAGWTGERPELETGRDRPWAFVTFCDDTFASEGYTSSGPDVTVIYHDWSLWLADLHNGDTGLDLESIVSEIELLGVEGRQNAHIWLGLYLKERAEAGFGCKANTCLNLLDDGEGWEGYCGTHADLIAQHDAGEHKTAPRFDDCPKCVQPHGQLEHTIADADRIEGTTFVGMAQGPARADGLRYWWVTFEIDEQRYSFIEGHAIDHTILDSVYSDTYGYGTTAHLASIDPWLWNQMEAARAGLCELARNTKPNVFQSALRNLGYEIPSPTVDTTRRCATCGGEIEDDPDGSEGVIVHARDSDAPDGYSGMDAFDLDEDHVALDGGEYNR